MRAANAGEVRTEGVSNSLVIICAMGAVVAPLPEPPAEQVTETNFGEKLAQIACHLRAVSRESSPLGGNMSNETGAVPPGCRLLKNLVDAHIVLL